LSREGSNNGGPRRLTSTSGGTELIGVPAAHDSQPDRRGQQTY
jgi:hypothetical protein